MRSKNQGWGYYANEGLEKNVWNDRNVKNVRNVRVKNSRKNQGWLIYANYAHDYANESRDFN